MSGAAISSSSKKYGGIFSVSCGASVFMALYCAMAAVNLYRLMFPLSVMDLSQYDYPEDFVHPLWKTDSRDEMYMRVYLSTKSRFTLAFLQADTYRETTETEETTNAHQGKPHVLLWDEKLDSPSFSKSFLLTQLDFTGEECADAKDDEDDTTCRIQKQTTDASYKYAVDWLDHAEHLAKAERDGEAGILSSLSAASGHGIESTSFLLTLYEALAKQLRSFLVYLGLFEKAGTEDEDTSNILERKNVQLDPTSPIWSALHSNSTLFLHVIVLRSGKNSVPDHLWPPKSISDAERALQMASRSHSLLVGQVSLIKFDAPNHIGKPKRLLYRDLVYLWNKHIHYSREMPPWVMAISKPEEYEAYQNAMSMKEKGQGYPYFKPEVSVKYVSDEDSYPINKAHESGMPVVKVRKDSEHPQGLAHLPVLHVDEFGMTSEKYIPINATITSLPLRISFDRSDVEHKTHGSTATAGAISPARWRLLNQLGDAIEKQRDFGFDESDIDDLKRLIADTNITLLAITMLASALHLLFEFLTFKSEISFWQKNKDLTGLSVRSLFLDMIGQTIVLLFLIEAESSLLTTIPSGIGCLIALWKCQRGFGFRFVKADFVIVQRASWWNWLPRLFGYELRATRLEAREHGNKDKPSKQQTSRDRLVAMTIESDRLATRYLGAVLLPLAMGYTLYSFFFNEHRSWYSWLVTSAASAVYALGFVLMTPQLFLNWKMKSVAHLPWRVLVYKSLNTFIDDLFSFIIRMPTMARISCFRDDIVFFVYLYQRWLYPVDESRPIEGGGEGKVAGESTSGEGETKKTR